MWSYKEEQEMGKTLFRIKIINKYKELTLQSYFYLGYVHWGSGYQNHSLNYKMWPPFRNTWTRDFKNCEIIKKKKLCIWSVWEEQGRRIQELIKCPKGSPPRYIYIYSLGYIVVVLILGLSFYILERRKISTENEEGREKEIKRVIFEVDKTMSNNVIHKP